MAFQQRGHHGQTHGPADPLLHNVNESSAHAHLVWGQQHHGGGVDGRKNKTNSNITSDNHPGAWGLACRCWRVFDLHDFRSDSLLDMGLAQTKEAHAISRISMYAGLKAAPYLVHA